MEQPKLGQLLDDSAGRDAIHIAIAPLVAAEKLYPGQDVGADGTTKSPIGIVDPFLKAPVFPGQKFYGFLYPNTITSLRYVWVHLAFEAQAAPKPVSLVDQLRACAGFVGNVAPGEAEIMCEAADAIERLTKERDEWRESAAWGNSQVSKVALERDEAQKKLRELCAAINNCAAWGGIDNALRLAKEFTKDGAA